MKREEELDVNKMRQSTQRESQSFFGFFSSSSFRKQLNSLYGKCRPQKRNIVEKTPPPTLQWSRLWDRDRTSLTKQHESGRKTVERNGQMATKFWYSGHSNKLWVEGIWRRSAECTWKPRGKCKRMPTWRMNCKTKMIRACLRDILFWTNVEYYILR